LSRIDAAFARARAEKRAALIVFVTAGDPDLQTTAELLPELAAAGADLIELGFPHSDPIGEGPTIQASSQRSLRHHTTLAQIFELVRRVRTVSEVPLVLMGYLNNVLAHGEEQFAKDCAASGVDGLILPDSPHEETEGLSRACDEHGVQRALLVAPTSTPLRVVRIAARSRGFVYCVSVTGVTGARTELPADLAQLVDRIRRVTPTPVCVGFGVATPAQAAQVAGLADGVIVGSALVSRIGAAPDRDAAIRSARDFVAELATAVRSVRKP
jgi:tryptophan synthase alpha chain